MIFATFCHEIQNPCWNMLRTFSDSATNSKSEMFFFTKRRPSKKIGLQMQASQPCPHLPTTPEQKKQQTGTSPKTNMTGWKITIFQ